jgi:hypothetical protein
LPGATLGGHSEGPLSGISFASEISIAAAANHLDPTLLAAIAAQETGGPSSDSGQNIKGDCTPNCHGYGVFQIDDRSHSDFTSTPQAMNPAVNAVKVIAVEQRHSGRLMEILCVMRIPCFGTKVESRIERSGAVND